MAIGSVSLVAAVVAAGFVALTRWSPEPVAAERPRPGVVEEAPPDELAGGREPPPVPDGVAEAADGPVVAAATADELPEGASCREEAAWTAGPDTESVILTPDGFQATLVGEGHPQEPLGPPPIDAPAEPDGQPAAEEPVALEVTCQAAWEDGAWRPLGGGARVRGPEAGLGHSSGSSCCDVDGLGTAHAEVPVGDEVAWLLQDRGGYWLAYPTEGVSVVTVTWRFRDAGFGGGSGFGDPGPAMEETFVRLLDADAEIIDERWVG